MSKSNNQRKLDKLEVQESNGLLLLMFSFCFFKKSIFFFFFLKKIETDKFNIFQSEKESLNKKPDIRKPEKSICNLLLLLLFV